MLRATVGRLSTFRNHCLGIGVSSRGRLRKSSDSHKGSRSHEDQGEFLERAEGGYGETTAESTMRYATSSLSITLSDCTAAK